MRYQVYLEDGIEGKALAWVLAYPGCGWGLSNAGAGSRESVGLNHASSGEQGLGPDFR